MAVQFFSLSQIGGSPEPFGLIRQDGPVVERFLPTQKVWVESPCAWDYLMGDEPGGKRITKGEADALVTRGKLAVLSQASIDVITANIPS